MKWVYLGLTVALGGLLVLMTLQQDRPFVVLTHPRVYSIYYSDPLDTIRMDLLTTMKDTYHWQKEYVEYVRIVSGEETLAFDLERVVVSEEEIISDESYVLIQLYLSPEIFLSDQRIDLLDARLELIYGNGEALRFDIGSVHLLFQADHTSDLALEQLDAIHEEIGGINTVSAIQIGLVNKTDGWLEIRSIDVLASEVTTNLGMFRTELDCSEMPSVSACLGVDEYAFFVPPVATEVSVAIAPSQATTVFVPLLYQHPLPFHRFAILVTYVQEGETKTMVIDDFPFVMTSSFQPVYEDRYVRHEWD